MPTIGSSRPSKHVTAIVVTISRDATSDTVKTTAAVRSAFKDLQARYPADQILRDRRRPGFHTHSINGVLQNLFEGILLTAIVLLLFLHVWRSALVVMIAIPASLLATFFVSWMLGFTIDVLSLMGLSLTIGILVDDSIVVIENITRHREMGQPPDDAAITGRSEIGGAAIAITLVDVVVFAPIAFMSGIIGQYMSEFGLVVVCATLFSLLVSFTLTPLLAANWALVRKPRPPVYGASSRRSQTGSRGCVSVPRPLAAGGDGASVHHVLWIVWLGLGI